MFWMRSRAPPPNSGYAFQAGLRIASTAPDDDVNAFRFNGFRTLKPPASRRGVTLLIDGRALRRPVGVLHNHRRRRQRVNHPTILRTSVPANLRRPVKP